MKFCSVVDGECTDKLFQSNIHYWPNFRVQKSISFPKNKKENPVKIPANKHISIHNVHNNYLEYLFHGKTYVYCQCCQCSKFLIDLKIIYGKTTYDVWDSLDNVKVHIITQCVWKQLKKIIKYREMKEKTFSRCK